MLIAALTVNFDGTLNCSLVCLRMRLKADQQSSRPSGLQAVAAYQQGLGRAPGDSIQAATARLQQAFRAGQRASPVSEKLAAVLVPLFEAADSHAVHVVLTQRSTEVSTHQGEVCLPGGRRDPEDDSDVATALREAEEELGIAQDGVQVLGQFPPALSKHRLSVTPVIGVIPAPSALRPNPAEVAAVFSCPLALFLEDGPCHQQQDAMWDSVPYRLHYFDWSAPEHGGKTFTVWGLTAAILIRVAACALGREPAFDCTSEPGSAFMGLRAG